MNRSIWKGEGDRERNGEKIPELASRAQLAICCGEEGIHGDCFRLANDIAEKEET